MSLAKLNPQESKKLLSLLVRAVHTTPKASDAAPAAIEYKQFPYWLQPRFVIGKREVVASCLTGAYDYNDRKDYPYPNVRWQEPSNQSIALNEKQLGDWSKLTIEEKKALYRYSYCQTFQEMDAPTGDWKLYLSAVFIMMGMAWWMFLFCRVYIVEGRTVPTLSEESMRDQLETMINLHQGAVQGVSSKWDYEKGTWKNAK